MERRTALGIAGGVTLAAAAVIAAVGVNAGLMSDRGGDQGPGIFEPVAAELRVDDSSTTVPAAPTAPAGVVTDDSTPSTTAAVGSAPTAPVGAYPAPSSPPSGSWDDDDHDDDHGGDRVDSDDRLDDHDDDHDDSGSGSWRGGDDDD